MIIKKFGKTFEVMEENNKTKFIEIKEDKEMSDAFKYIEEKFMIDSLSPKEEEKKDIFNALKAMKYIKSFTYNKYGDRESYTREVSPYGSGELENILMNYPSIEIADNGLIILSSKNKSITIDLDEIHCSHVWVSSYPSSVEDEDGKQKYLIELNLTIKKDNSTCTMYISGYYER